MARKEIVICDRCGKEFDNVFLGERQYYICTFKEEIANYRSFDVCPDCYKEFVKWWREKKNE